MEKKNLLNKIPIVLGIAAGIAFGGKAIYGETKNYTAATNYTETTNILNKIDNQKKFPAADYEKFCIGTETNKTPGRIRKGYALLDLAYGKGSVTIGADFIYTNGIMEPNACEVDINEYWFNVITNNDKSTYNKLNITHYSGDSILSNKSVTTKEDSGRRSSFAQN